MESAAGLVSGGVAGPFGASVDQLPCGVISPLMHLEPPMSTARIACFILSLLFSRFEAGLHLDLLVVQRSIGQASAISQTGPVRNQEFKALIKGRPQVGIGRSAHRASSRSEWIGAVGIGRLQRPGTAAHPLFFDPLCPREKRQNPEGRRGGRGEILPPAQWASMIRGTELPGGAPCRRRQKPVAPDPIRPPGDGTRIGSSAGGVFCRPARQSLVVALMASSEGARPGPLRKQSSIRRPTYGPSWWGRHSAPDGLITSERGQVPVRPAWWTTGMPSLRFPGGRTGPWSGLIHGADHAFLDARARGLASW